MEEKINIFVPESTALILNNDARLFEILKKDGISVNRNHFLCLLFTGYRELYDKETDQQKETIIHELIQCLHCSSGDARNAAERILARTSISKHRKKRGGHSIKFSFKPTISSSWAVGDLSASDLTDILIAYTRKPLYEREQIIFRENYEKLQKACQTHINVDITLTSGKIHTVVPYSIVYGKEEMSNYLLCQEEVSFSRTDSLSPAGVVQACTYRLSRISSVTLRSDLHSSISGEIRELLSLTEKYGPQYAINDDKEIVVRLTEDGLRLYRRIYFGRPEYETLIKEGNEYYCHFHCSENQAFLYFRRFSGNAEIIKPERLRRTMINFHKKALELYDPAFGNPNADSQPFPEFH